MIPPPDIDWRFVFASIDLRAIETNSPELDVPHPVYIAQVVIHI